MDLYYLAMTAALFAIAVTTGTIRAVFFCIMVYNRKPEIRLCDTRLYLRLFTDTSLLNEKGIYWRNKSVGYSIVFIVASLSFIFVFLLNYS